MLECLMYVLAGIQCVYTSVYLFPACLKHYGILWSMTYWNGLIAPPNCASIFFSSLLHSFDTANWNIGPFNIMYDTLSARLIL
jgi:hypothetical protein